MSALTRRRAVAAVAAIFFVSGASGLIFETLWFEQAGLAFGSSVWASSLVLAAFMAGLAVGSALAGRAGDLLGAPIRVYAALEVMIAVSGVALVYGLPALGSALAPALGGVGERPLALNALRLGLAFVFLALPSTAMGATLPLLARALGAGQANFGRVLGLLYGFNTLGAVLGVVSTETLFVGAFGVRGTAWFAGAANLVASAGAVAVAKFSRLGKKTRSEPLVRALRSSFVHEAAALLAGFILLALEVVWLRLLSLGLNGTALAFAMVLSVVLAGIAAGGLAAGRWSARAPALHRYAGLVALAAGALGVAGLRLLPLLGAPFLQSGEQDAVNIALLCAPLVFPTSFASGALFTLLGAALRDELGGRESAATGRIAFANSVGAALGALVAGFVLLPLLGMERSLLSLFAAYAAIGVLLLVRAKLTRKTAAIGALGFAAALALFPFGAVRARYMGSSIGKWVGPSDRIIAVREGRDATLAVVEHRAFAEPVCEQLLTNAFSMSTTCFYVRRYAKLFVYLPFAVSPRIKSALVVGYGAGNTVTALVDSSEIGSIDVVDISRDILGLSAVVHSGEPDPLADPRVRVHVEDGRWFLEGSARRFDLVTGEPPPHHLAGVANLYSKEFFQLIRARLNPGGFASYWLHVGLMTKSTATAILRAFCDAFEDCSLWHGSGNSFMMVGSNGATGPVDEQTFSRQWRDPKALLELRALGFEQPEQLGALFVGDSVYLRRLTADSDAADDDHPQRLKVDLESEQAESVVEAWRDEEAARERFRASPLVARLIPPRLRERALPFFDDQRLLNDLLFKRPSAGFSKSLTTLEGVLRAGRVSLPALLLLDSDPDLQRAAAAAALERPDDPDVLRHLAVGSVAAHDYARALWLLGRLNGSRYSAMAQKLADRVNKLAERQ